MANKAAISSAEAVSLSCSPVGISGAAGSVAFAGWVGAGATGVDCLTELDGAAGLTAANKAAISSAEAVSLSCSPVGILGAAGSGAFAGWLGAGATGGVCLTELD